MEAAAEVDGGGLGPVGPARGVVAERVREGAVGGSCCCDMRIRRGRLSQSVPARVRLVEGSIWRRELNWAVGGCWSGGGGDGVVGGDVGECWSRMLPSKGLAGTRSGEVEERKKNIRKIIWLDNGIMRNRPVV